MKKRCCWTTVTKALLPALWSRETRRRQASMLVEYIYILCSRVHTHTHTHIAMCTCARVRAHTHTHTTICTYAHVRTYTHHAMNMKRRMVRWKAVEILWFWKAMVQWGGTSWEFPRCSRPLPAQAPLCSSSTSYICGTVLWPAQVHA